MQRNPALTTSFRLEIPDFVEVNYFAQSTELPGVSMAGIDSPFKNNQGALPSNKMEYDPFNFTFQVDEDYVNYRILFTWMNNITKSPGPLINELKDVTLHLLTSNKTSGQKIVFYGAFPTMLSTISYDNSVIDPTVIPCTVTFRYQYFNFV